MDIDSVSSSAKSSLVVEERMAFISLFALELKVAVIFVYLSKSEFVNERSTVLHGMTSESLVWIVGVGGLLGESRSSVADGREKRLLEDGNEADPNGSNS